MEKIHYNKNKDNIFAFHFMDDFTTVNSILEDFAISKNIAMGRVVYEGEDDFYCLSEKKVYSEKELFKKFNIVIE